MTLFDTRESLLKNRQNLTNFITPNPNKLPQFVKKLKTFD